MARTVIAAVDDLFFASKIRGTAEQLGVDARFARSVDAVIEAAREHRPALIIADLHSKSCAPIELARRLRADEELRAIPLLGFFSHTQTDLRRAAEEAGYDQVLARSAFTLKLADLLSGRL